MTADDPARAGIEHDASYHTQNHPGGWQIGIRMALGAQAADVRRSVLRYASPLLLLGLVIGLAAAAALAGSVEGLLFQVQPRDMTIYAAAGAVLLTAGLAAAYLPARRASRVDPLVALRLE